jgi:hypothetical protein
VPFNPIWLSLTRSASIDVEVLADDVAEQSLRMCVAVDNVAKQVDDALASTTWASCPEAEKAVVANDENPNI